MDQTGNDDPSDLQSPSGSRLNRRWLLRALGTGSVLPAVTGCLGLIRNREFVAVLVRIALTFAGTIDARILTFDRPTRTVERTAAGISVDVAVTYNLLTYELLGGLYGFGILSVPKAQLAGFDLLEIADQPVPQIVQDPERRTGIVNQLGLTDIPVDAVEDPHQLGSRTVQGSPVYDTPVRVYRYVARLRGGGATDDGTDVLLFEVGKGTGVPGDTDSNDAIFTGIALPGTLESPDAPFGSGGEMGPFDQEDLADVGRVHDEILGHLEPSTPETIETAMPVTTTAPADTTTAAAVSLELSVADTGPFTANGRDVAAVTVTATDADGSPVNDLILQATVFTGDDEVRSLPVSAAGAGEYSVAVTAETKGTATLAVTAPEFGVKERVGIEFDPGPPDHFWITSVSPPSLGDADPVARFNLLLRDRNGNLIPPSESEYRITTEDPNATVTRRVDPEKELVAVAVGLNERPIPSPSNGTWTEFDVRVTEATSGHTRQTRVTFPLLDAVFRPAQVDGNDVYTLTLYTVDLAPLESFEVDVPLEENRFELVATDPGPVEVDVLELPEALRIRGEAINAGVGLTRLVTLVIQVTESLGQTEIPVTVRNLTFEALDPVSFVHPLAVKLLTEGFTTLCLKIWMVEGTDEDEVDADLASLREVFGKSFAHCCPAVFFDEEKETIEDKDDPDEWDWDKVDENDDDHLEPFGDKDESGDVPVTDPSDEQQNLIDNFNDEDCLNVYYVPDLPGGTIGQAGGEWSDTDDKWSFDTNGERDKNWVFVSNDGGAGNEKTLVHELGHLLDLKHPPDPEDDEDVPESNIMLQTGEDGDPGTFSEEQCDRLREILG